MIAKQVENEPLALKKHQIGDEIIYRPTTIVGDKNNGEFHVLISEKSVNQSNGTFFLWLTTVTVSLTCFCLGFAFSWTSPVFVKLDAADSPLGRPSTAEEKSWIATLMSIGAVVGPLVSTKMANYFGRKRSIIFWCVPMATALIILAFATNVYWFYLARLLHGISVGTLVALVPAYISELSETHNRGKFICAVNIFVTGGILFPFAVGPYLSIKWFCLVCASPLVIFFAIFPTFMPETPHYYVAKNRQSDAEKVLMRLRNTRDKNHIKKELLEVVEMIEYNKMNSGGIKDLFTVPGLRKCFLVAAGLVTLQQVSGINAVTGYLHHIFEVSGSKIPTNIATLLVGLTKVSTTAAITFLVEKLGRKTLLIISSIGCVFTLLILGVYYYLQQRKYDLSGVWWLPIATIMLYIVCFNSGVGPMPFTVAAEIFPSNAKSVGSALTASTCFAVQSIVTWSFPIVSHYIGMGQCFMIFAFCCFLGILFVCFKVPETKGKTLLEIQNIMFGYDDMS